MRPLHLNGIAIALVFACWSPAFAQNTVTLTLDEAIQIALVNNYALQETRMDAALAHADVRTAWSATMPRVDASSGYTRNLRTANPFAGSAAGDFFFGLRLHRLAGLQRRSAHGRRPYNGADFV